MQLKSFYLASCLRKYPFKLILKWSSFDIQSQRRNGIAKFARCIEVELRLYEISISFFRHEKHLVISDCHHFPEGLIKIIHLK